MENRFLSLIKYPSPELFPNFVTIDEFPGVFHRTTLDNYGKIRMTSVKLKNEIIITMKNISNFMDFIFIKFCDILVKLIYS